MTKICIELPTGPDNTLPTPPAPVDPDFGMPERIWGKPDQGLPTPPGSTKPVLPAYPDQGLPPVVDNGLPGIDGPIDPSYGIDAPVPGVPDNTLPSPTPAFTAAEKKYIHALARAKFVNTDTAPMRCYIQAARFVVLQRRSMPGAAPKV